MVSLIHYSKMAVDSHLAISWLTVGKAVGQVAAAAAAKSLQSCPTLCNPMEGSPPGSAIPGFLRKNRSGLPFPSPRHESEK